MADHHLSPDQVQTPMVRADKAGILLAIFGSAQQPRQVLPMHRLHVFKQLEEAQGVIGRQSLIAEVGNQLVLKAKVPLAFVNMPPGLFDIIVDCHLPERRWCRDVPRVGCPRLELIARP
ncbi:hypothetical protein EOA60_07750 [Mesorhizobium sp. M1A.F.Ca.IN.020.06.1.1]|uniref:hypothetical protein n=1 Tax=unclassified Mesorhizobium TaxID=325217 RepID=UPI000FC9DA1A|nr:MULTISPECIES: hypothetical protein [unclassified Mesorhizobium]RUV07728.1 hypothetical protein EOA79_03445 [Mesorhizobium sp. M1A.F.Ca.IN.020.03.2.1]RUV90158.1 hypothetical protein EOA51_00090 [Mesorhizobium sp. M1A.F.Ca.IN.020.32.1.1]RUW14908.1 hypothetical protein EOA46_01905 [Mesorhizobium sp. M1A.F.Ca.IN.022.05.2.1]RUW33431.1 hypothetical protein EOA60_07750 [Mesorhizobium sp. M1A.F.Ca.IN.020.06.1.1]RWF84456.1 MAG: hypothetical protein EOQ35_02045 [Mesorhizobium sp.]